MGDGAVPGKGDRVPAAFRLTKIGMGLMLGATSREKSADVVNVLTRARVSPRPARRPIN